MGKAISVIKAWLGLFLGLGVGVWGLGAEAHSPKASLKSAYHISPERLKDKIKGGWAGQIIGVSFGAPAEFRSLGKIIDDSPGHYNQWRPDRVNNALDQDDLYVEMTFAEVMDKKGLDATTEDYAAMFAASGYSLWHANAGARRLLNQGISPRLSGTPAYNGHANDIDFQIESDFIGLMTPAMPEVANIYAKRIGQIMNWGDGLYGGMFFGGMYSAAFVLDDPRAVVEAGLRSIPPESDYAAIIRDVLRWSREHPDDWRTTWRLIEEKWDKDDACPEGAASAFNIDAKLNGAYVVLGLLYGHKDMSLTLEIATRSGQDADCNASSAAGILGTILGYSHIPVVWTSGLEAIADQPFSYTHYSYRTIVLRTQERALKLIKRHGGHIGAQDITIPKIALTPVPLQQWDMGHVIETHGMGDPLWRLNGFHKITHDDQTLGASTAEAEAAIEFQGEGLAILGRSGPWGGRADVFVDEQNVGMIDAFAPKNTYDGALFHLSGLRAGAHRLRIVTRSDHNARSEGQEVQISQMIGFKGGRLIDQTKL